MIQLSHFYYVCIACCVFMPTWTTGFSFNGFKQYRLVPTTYEAVSVIRRLSQEFPPEPNPNSQFRRGEATVKFVVSPPAFDASQAGTGQDVVPKLVQLAATVAATSRSDGRILTVTSNSWYALVPSHALGKLNVNGQAGLTFLTMPGQKFEPVDLIVPPAMESAFLTAVRSTGAVRTHLLHGNYGRLIAKFNQQNSRSRSAAASNRRQRRHVNDGANQNRQTGLTLSHTFYRSFSEIRDALLKLNSRCNQLLPGTCRLETIGKTFQNNNLIVLRISKTPSTGYKTKIWIDGGIHAREWISPATVLFVADRLISDLLSNTSLTASILDNHVVMLLPMYNPDGYEFSRTQNRMWRKNREPSMYHSCQGVDLNRNYGYKWGGRASVGRPCDITYRGAAAFSALETSAVKRFVESERTGLILFLSFHSYGQCILMPFGYKRRTYSNTHREKMQCAASAAVYGMYSINQRFYDHGTGSDLMYEANGGSDDWAHGTAKIPYSFTIELPDDGNYGFLLPASQVAGVGQEVAAGLQAMLDAIRRLEARDPLMMEEVCRGWMSR